MYTGWYHKLQNCVTVIDASASLDDFNNPMFIMSTSCAAGGLPIGVVITSGESGEVMAKALSELKDTFPDDAFSGRGRDMGPLAIMSDDSSAEKEGLKQVWPESMQFL